jgi:hypothetical protein
LSDVPSPKASRQRLPRWLDPKLILGILLVLGSMAAGARILSDNNRTVQVWALKQDLAADANVSKDALVATSVRFTSKTNADQYVSATKFPDGARMLRKVSKGEFLPRDAFTTDEKDDLVDLPIPISPQNIPAGVTINKRVDVYIVPKDSKTVPKNGLKVLTNVVVTSVPGSRGLTGSEDSKITLRLGVDPTTIDIDDVVNRLVNGTAVVVLHVGE